MLCRFRFLVYILMLSPSNVGIPNCFTNVCFLTNTRYFINLARRVRVLIFQRKLSFNILFNLLHSYLKLLFGELMELFQESFSCQLILWAIWKLQQYRFLRNFKRTRWYNVLIFLVLCLIRLLLVVSDDTIRKRWVVTCVIKFLLNQHLFFVEACSYIRSTLHISPWMAFS